MPDDSPSAIPVTDGGDESPADRSRRLYAHLEATAELPIDRTANRWLGEAEAIAADLATSDISDATALERVEKIRRLLSAVDETGHDEADDHLEAAKGVCREILEEDG